MKRTWIHKQPNRLVGQWAILENFAIAGTSIWRPRPISHDEEPGLETFLGPATFLTRNAVKMLNVLNFEGW